MVWPAQTPKRNIQRNMQKHMTPMPTIPMMLSSNLIYFFFFLFVRAIRTYRLHQFTVSGRSDSFVPYMLSGALNPTDCKPFLNTIRKPSANQSRARESSASSEITICLL